LVLALHHTILLRCVRGREVTLDPLIGAIGDEFLDGELVGIVHA
jgi:hypothetical protein